MMLLVIKFILRRWKNAALSSFLMPFACLMSDLDHGGCMVLRDVAYENYLVLVLQAF